MAGILFAMTIFFTVLTFIGENRYCIILPVITGVACAFTIRRIMSEKKPDKIGLMGGV